MGAWFRGHFRRLLPSCRAAVCRPVSSFTPSLSTHTPPLFISVAVPLFMAAPHPTTLSHLLFRVRRRRKRRKRRQRQNDRGKGKDMQLKEKEKGSFILEGNVVWLEVLRFSCRLCRSMRRDLGPGFIPLNDRFRLSTSRSPAPIVRSTWLRLSLRLPSSLTVADAFSSFSLSRLDWRNDGGLRLSVFLSRPSSCPDFILT
ncbi:hypothetical protein BHM03_00045542 [Ensete ventricosum]|nr:hypothetical protein BHM03_00045542 [Ensete ventricosum]